MTEDEARQILLSASKVQFPQLDRKLARSIQIETVMDFAIDVAVARDMVEEARVHVGSALDLLLDRWEALDVDVDGRITAPALEAARREAEPELGKGVRSSRRLVERLTEQVQRLENADRSASRLYTMLTGG